MSTSTALSAVAMHATKTIPCYSHINYSKSRCMLVLLNLLMQKPEWVKIPLRNGNLNKISHMTQQRLDSYNSLVFKIISCTKKINWLSFSSIWIPSHQQKNSLFSVKITNREIHTQWKTQALLSNQKGMDRHVKLIYDHQNALQSLNQWRNQIA